MELKQKLKVNKVQLAVDSMQLGDLFSNENRNSIFNLSFLIFNFS